MASCPRVEAGRNVDVVESAGDPNSKQPFDTGAEDARSHFQDQGGAQRSLPGFSEAEGKGRPSVYQRDSANARSIPAHSCVGHLKCSASAAEYPSPRSKDSKKFSKVRFDAQPITAIWPAHTSKEYDRRSIVVDLSKTPFALFRKDAVLMKTATASAAAPSAPLPRPSPAALAVSYQVRDAPLKSPVSSTSQEMQVAGSEDSDTSDSSIGHTDTETDLDPSDSDSSPCSKKIPGLRKSIADVKPAYFGVWKRTSSEGYEELLQSSGVPKKAAVMAMRKHPVHIIDHDGAYFRLIVKNGLSKVDNTFFIGDEPRVVSTSKVEKCFNAYFYFKTFKIQVAGASTKTPYKFVCLTFNPTDLFKKLLEMKRCLPIRSFVY